MSLQRLYNLDKAFSDQLDALLHEEQYVGELQKLPEGELVQLVNHLDDVGFRSVTEAQSFITSIDPDSSQSYRRDIQKVPPRVTENMWLSESPPANLRIARGYGFDFSQVAERIWRVL